MKGGRRGEGKARTGPEVGDGPGGEAWSGDQVLDDAGKLYLPLGLDHKNPNTRLMPFVAKRVKITGSEFDKGGLASIAIRTIEPAQ